jgi:O-antigen ligase
VAAALLTFWIGAEKAGRIILEQGSFADPNTFAMSLLIGLPFLYLKAQNSSNVVVKLAVCGGIVIVLGVVAQTGSRSGLITLLGMAVILFFRVSVRGKFALLLVATAAVLLSPLIISGDLKDRYMTLLGEDKTSTQQVAAGSSRARTHLFWQSVYLTFKNPILGVGPGMFAVAENNYSLENLGIRGAWHDTHNAYTQVSSECGIPALLFYATALGSTLLVPWRILKVIPQNATGDRLQIRNAAIALELSLAAFLIFSCFLSVAYAGMPFVLMGVSACFGRTVAPVLAEQQRTNRSPTSVSSTPAGSFVGGQYNSLVSSHNFSYRALTGGRTEISRTDKTR